MWFKTPYFLIQKFLLSPWLLTTPAERLEALLTGREFPMVGAMEGQSSVSFVWRKRFPEAIFVGSLYNLAQTLARSVWFFFFKVFLLPLGLRFFVAKLCRNIQKWWLEESAWCQFFLSSCIVAFYKERHNNRIPQAERTACKDWLDYSS